MDWSPFKLSKNVISTYSINKEQEEGYLQFACLVCRATAPLKHVLHSVTLKVRIPCVKTML